MNRTPKPASGRTSIACLNTVLFLVTGSVLWLVVFLAFSTWLAAPPPFMPVIVFAALGGVLSFVLNIDIALKVFTAAWRLIGKITAWFIH